MSSNILLADDSSTIQKVVKITLPSNEFSIVSVDNVIDLYKQNEKKEFDIILLDFRLSREKDGHSIAQELKNQNPGVKILMLFGTFDTIDQKLLNEHGVDGHVVKPFDSGKFLQVCKKIISADSSVPIQSSPDLEKLVTEEVEPETNKWEISVPPTEHGQDIPLPPKIDITPESKSNSFTEFSFPEGNDLDYPNMGEKAEEAPVTAKSTSPIVNDKEQESHLEAEINQELSSEDFWSVDSGISKPTKEIEEEINIEKRSETKKPVPEPVFEEDPLLEELTTKPDTSDIKEQVRIYCEDEVKKIAWEIIPELAENLIKKELKQIRKELNI